MTRPRSKTRTNSQSGWRAFEAEVRRSLDLAKQTKTVTRWTPLEDGMRLAIDHRKPKVTNPYTGEVERQYRPIAAAPQPSDFMGLLPDGGLLLVEAKQVSSGHLSASRPDDWGRPPKKDTGQLKYHQLDWLIQVDDSGGAGLLVVSWVEHGAVTVIRGRELDHWLTYGDVKPRVSKSISFDFAQRYGETLGRPGFWRFSQLNLLPRKAFEENSAFPSHFCRGDN